MGKKSSKEIIRDRQNKVVEFYFIRKYTIAEVAKALGWDHQTIWRDIQAIRLSFYDELQTTGMLDPKTILLIIMKERNKVLKSLWKAYDNATSVSLQIQALTKIDEIERKLVEDLQELGFIPKPKDTLELKESTLMADIKKMLEDEQD